MVFDCWWLLLHHLGATPFYNHVGQATDTTVGRTTPTTSTSTSTSTSRSSSTITTVAPVVCQLSCCDGESNTSGYKGILIQRLFDSSVLLRAPREHEHQACLSASNIGDQWQDCADNSDENGRVGNCPEYQQTTRRSAAVIVYDFFTCAPGPVLPSNQTFLSCCDGRSHSIRADMVNNNLSDCADGSDETGDIFACTRKLHHAAQIACSNFSATVVVFKSDNTSATSVLEMEPWWNITWDAAKVRVDEVVYYDNHLSYLHDNWGALAIPRDSNCLNKDDCTWIFWTVVCLQLLVNLASAQVGATASATQDDADLVRMVRMQRAPTWWSRLDEDFAAPGTFRPLPQNLEVMTRKVALRDTATSWFWMVADILLFICVPFLAPPLLCAGLYPSRSKEHHRRGETLSLAASAGYVPRRDSTRPSVRPSVRACVRLQPVVLAAMLQLAPASSFSVACCLH